MSYPNPPAESVLIERARADAHLSVREAARRAGISEGWWRQIAKGYQTLSGGSSGEVRGPAETLAKMARVVGITSVQMEAEGERPDVAEEMRRMPAVPLRPEPDVLPHFAPILDADPEAIEPYEKAVRAEIATAFERYGLDAKGSQVFPDSPAEAATWDTGRLPSREEKVRFISKLRMYMDNPGSVEQTG
jgi:transcriptional regulator with XRE-family HTH domain